MIEHALWLFPVSGFGVGILIGLTGIGGGIVMMPLLILGFGFSPSVAVGTDLAYAALTKLAGTWQHWRQGTVEKRLVRDLALGSVPASLIAVQLLSWMRQHDALLAERWLERAVGMTLLLAAGLLLQRVLGKRPGTLHRVSAPYGRARVIAIGAIGGFLVGLTSVGSGSLILALLALEVSLPPERLVGTDIAHATLLLGVAALAHLRLGYVNPIAVGLLLVGSVPGVLLGSRLTLRVPRHALQAGLAGLLTILAVRLLA